MSSPSLSLSELLCVMDWIATHNIDITKLTEMREIPCQKTNPQCTNLLHCQSHDTPFISLGPSGIGGSYQREW